MIRLLVAHRRERAQLGAQAFRLFDLAVHHGVFEKRIRLHDFVNQIIPLRHRHNEAIRITRRQDLETVRQAP